jgi:hypothetical protein
VNLGPPSKEAVFHSETIIILEKLWEYVFFVTWNGCILVYTENNSRVVLKQGSDKRKLYTACFALF